MKILDLKEAAAFLKMAPEVLRRHVAKGKIPGVKPGKHWIFMEEDLVEYLRSRYSSTAKALQGVINRRKIWRSTKEVIHGGSQLVTKVRAYKNLLGLPTK